MNAILVTGATGNVGRPLVTQLVDAYIALLAATVDKPALVTHDVEKILGRPAEPFADAVSANRQLFTNH